MAGLGALGGGGLFAGKSLAVLGAGLLAGAVGRRRARRDPAPSISAAPGRDRRRRRRGLELVPCPDQGPVIGTIPRDQQVLVTGAVGRRRLAPALLAGARHRARLDEGRPAPARAATSRRCRSPAARRRPPPRRARRPSRRRRRPPTPTPDADADARRRPRRPTRRQPTPDRRSPRRRRRRSRTRRPRSAASGIADDDQLRPGDVLRRPPRRARRSPSRPRTPTGSPSVTLFYRRPGSTTYVQKPMTLSNGRYVATLDTTADKPQDGGRRCCYYVVATDANASPKSDALARVGHARRGRQGLRQHRSRRSRS